MLKQLILTLIGLMFINLTDAQRPDGDYAFLKLKQWDVLGHQDSIIEYANRYNLQNIESFYVHHIVGKVFFQRHNYRRAITYLEKAGEFNRNSSDNNVMLYYAYQYCGNEVMAKYRASKITKDDKKKEEIMEFRGVEKIYLESGHCFSDNIEKNGTTEFVVEEPISINNNQFLLTDDYTYFHGGIQWGVTPSLSTFVSFSSYKIDEKIHQIIVPDLQYKEHYFQASENDLYTNITIRLGKTWSMSPAYHGQKYISFREIFENGLPKLKDSIFYSQLFSLQMRKNTMYSNHHYTLGFSSINLAKQWHVDYDYYHFPRGNLDFYTSWNFGFVLERGSIAPHIRFMLGNKISSWCWTEAFLGLGNLRNGSEDNGYILYNFNDNSILNGGLNLIFPITKHIEARINYQYWLKSVIYQSEEKSAGRGQKESTMNKFNNHNFSGGILWKL